MSATDSDSPRDQTANAVGSDDLVVRLRYGWTPFADEISGLMRQAADEIEKLSVLVKRPTPVPLPTRDCKAGVGRLPHLDGVARQGSHGGIAR